MTQRNSHLHGQQQQGFVLVVCMLVMLIMAMLALSMFRGMAVQEHVAGVVRDKQVSLSQAIAAEEFAEWWLVQQAGQPSLQSSTCFSGPPITIDVTNGGNARLRVCDAPLANPTLVEGTSSSWSGNTGTNLLSSSSLGTASNPPGVYIYKIANSGSNGTGYMYQILAYGYGGSAQTISVVQSLFVVNTNNACAVSSIHAGVC